VQNIHLTAEEALVIRDALIHYGNELADDDEQQPIVQRLIRFTKKLLRGNL